MLSGSISAHLSIQGSWGVGSGAATLFDAWKKSRMNIIGSRIIRLKRKEAEEEQGTETSTETELEEENRDG